jgi:hypothetical protein
MPAEFKPSKLFHFNPTAAPAIVTELGLDGYEVAGIETHQDPFLDRKTFSSSREYQVMVRKTGDKAAKAQETQPLKGLRLVYAYGYWVASYKGFMYVEAMPDKGDFLGAIDLARVQVKLSRELFETEAGDKVFLPHWALINYTGIPRPSAGTVVAGIISAAYRVLKGQNNGLLLHEAFCETDELLFTTKKPDLSGSKSIKNFIRLGSNMDRIFINPLEHDQDPTSALAYLKRKHVLALENLEQKG